MTKSLLIFHLACTSNSYSSRNTIVVCFRKLIMKQCTTTMAVFAWIVLQTESFKCIMWNWDRSAYHEFTFSLSTRIYIYRVLTIFIILWLNVLLCISLMITKGKQILHNADFLCNIKSANAKINKTPRWNDRGLLKQSFFFIH